MVPYQHAKPQEQDNVRVEKESEFCLHTEFDAYECYFDKESKIVGARYDEDREEVVYVSVFDLRNMLHLKKSR